MALPILRSYLHVPEDTPASIEALRLHDLVIGTQYLALMLFGPLRSSEVQCLNKIDVGNCCLPGINLRVLKAAKVWGVSCKRITRLQIVVGLWAKAG